MQWIAINKFTTVLHYYVERLTRFDCNLSCWQKSIKKNKEKFEKIEMIYMLYFKMNCWSKQFQTSLIEFPFNSAYVLNKKTKQTNQTSLKSF